MTHCYSVGLEVDDARIAFLQLCSLLQKKGEDGSLLYLYENCHECFLFNLSRHRQFTGMHIHKHIYKHIFVELFLSVLQCACDQRETQDYNGGPHGAYKGIDGRGVATRIPSLTENDSMFFMELRLAITRFLCQHVKGAQMEISAKSLSAVLLFGIIDEWFCPVMDYTLCTCS